MLATEIRTYSWLAARVLALPPRCGDVRVVCVDGPAGSGKTQFAARLSAALDDAPAVHMDDLYDGWDGALGTTLAAHVRGWLLDPWRSGRDGRHPVYDWAAGRYAGNRLVPPAPVVLVEGVGSASAGIRDAAVVVVWVEAPEDALLDRVLRRDGPALRDRMREWQVRERDHFRLDRTRAAADLLVDGAPDVGHDPDREFVLLCP